MKKVTPLLLIGLVLMLGGCGDSYDKLADDMMGLMRDFVSILEGVETVDDAKAASGKLDALVTRAQDLKARYDKLGKPDKDTEKRLEEKHKSEMDELQKRMTAFMKKIALKPEVAKELQASMVKLGEAMKDIK